MRKYNLLYVKRVAAWVAVISISLTLLFLIAALISRTLQTQFLTCLSPISVGMIVWAASLSRMPFANRLVNEQKGVLGVDFDDTGAAPLYPKSGIFLSDNWLIASGRLYLHRNFILNVAIEARPFKGRKDYYCLFKCRDGDHRLPVDSSVSAKKIKDWVDAENTYSK